VSSILDAAGVTELPKAKTVVLDGTRFSPSQPKKYGEQSVRILWGEMAWQLGGADAFAKVAESDANGTAPDSSLTEDLLKPYQPGVVLVDELVAYFRQFEDGRSYPGGTFDSNLTFVQNLTQAFKAVPKAMLLISLPASKLSEAGSARGRRAMESIEGALSLASLEKTVGRVSGAADYAALAIADFPKPTCNMSLPQQPSTCCASLPGKTEPPSPRLAAPTSQLSSSA
jgi:hypothetical protein